MRRRILQNPNPVFSSKPSTRTLFGRNGVIESLIHAIRDCRTVALTGAHGIGKSAVASELIRQQHGVFSRVGEVKARKEESFGGLVARIERVLDVIPGTLATERSPEFLVLENAQNLSIDVLHQVIQFLRKANGLHCLIVSDASVPLRGFDDCVNVELQPLQHSSVRDFWSFLEETHGPTPSSSADTAEMAEGMPQQIRRLYSEAVAGANSWDTNTCSEIELIVLRTLSVLDFPVSVSALVDIAPELELEGAEVLKALAIRQLVDVSDDGLYSLNPAVTLAPIEERHLIHARIADAIGLQRPWFGDDVERTIYHITHLIAARRNEEAVSLVKEWSSLAGLGGVRELYHFLLGLEHSLFQPQIESMAVHLGKFGRALDHSGKEDTLSRGLMLYRSGDIAQAIRVLEKEAGSGNKEAQIRACAALISIDCMRGDFDRALARARQKEDTVLSTCTDEAKAEFSVSLAEVYVARGEIGAARQVLARCEETALSPMQRVSLSISKAHCYTLENRSSLAEEALGGVEQVISTFDLVGMARRLVRQRALLSLSNGVDLEGASDQLAWVVSESRGAGDEILALVSETDLAITLAKRGYIRRAAEAASAALKTASTMKLTSMEARAEFALALVEIAEFQLERSAERLQRIVDAGTTEFRTREKARAELRALQPSSAQPQDKLGLPFIRSITTSNPSQAMVLAKDASVQAERQGAEAVLADCLATIARLQVARGERGAALVSAERAITLAEKHGAIRPKVEALLASAALVRERGENAEAEVRSKKAADLATEAGLVVERVAAVHASELLSGTAGRAAVQLAPAAHPTLSEAAVDAAGRLLADLGLMAARPYRVVAADGESSFVADASAEVMGFANRALAVDGVREVIFRAGTQVADLRRRTLLKKLLFLFASSPGKTYSKETIVELVWEVEYHPLRHDAALFTNIMRIRRLLGEDGADLIRVSEEGYRFCPPDDFIYVEPTSSKA